MQIRRKKQHSLSSFFYRRSIVVLFLLYICVASLFYRALYSVSEEKGALRASVEKAPTVRYDPVAPSHDTATALKDSAHPHVYDVLIVGSGWSGLGAATTLAEEGIENIEILEARDYVGGRSRTVYPFTEDLAVEMGSAFTYDETLVHEILEENDIPFGEVKYDLYKTFGLYQSGYFQGASDEEVSGEITGKERKRLVDKVWWDEFVKFADEQHDEIHNNSEEQDYPFQTIVDDFFKAHNYANNSKSRQFVQTMVDAQFRVEYAASFDELSARYAGNKADDCVFCGAIHYTPVKGGGFDKALAHLADPLEDKIRLEHIVTKIEYHDDKPARVTYVDATDNTTHTRLAERVLVTVPLGVLKAKSIEFVPTLPDWKQHAIDLVGFGVLNKCIFYWDKTQFTEATMMSWWPRGKDVMTLVTDQDATSGKWTTFFNDLGIGNGGEFVLSSWVGGDHAEEIENQSDEAIVKQVLGNLRAMFGENVPDPSKYLISRWRHDEFARGSYSFISVGGRKAVDPAREDLARTVGEHLFWAGEASNKHDYGTTFGAHWTGVKAAQRIKRSLAKADAH